MFNNSKYTKWYFSLIQSRKMSSGRAGENHHIIPKSLGGSNDDENLIRVSFRIHFILHRLLPRMVDDPKSKTKMRYAEWMMTTRSGLSNTSRQYSKVKERFQLDLSANNPMKNPATVAKVQAGRKASGHSQSETAKKRNLAYWTDENKAKHTRDQRARILATKGEIVCSFQNEVINVITIKEAMSVTGLSLAGVYKSIRERKSVSGWTIQRAPVDSVSKSNRQNSG